MNLYLTADRVSGWSGGSQVVAQESQALAELGPCEVQDREGITKISRGWVKEYAEPWKWDQELAGHLLEHKDLKYVLGHLYAGTFSESVQILKERGTQISYTAAAHDVTRSRLEHEKFGIRFVEAFPHLYGGLWDRYVAGYLAADVVICPSQHSRRCMLDYGCQRVEVIPHGVNLPAETRPPPPLFTVGYLGSCTAPDKGVIYLLQAWKLLDWKGPTLVLAGHDSQSPLVTHWIQEGGITGVRQLGFVENISDFYNGISLYVQPSITEGFGIEVLEAMAHRRPVLCSDGAGACDVVPGEEWGFQAGNVQQLAEKLDWARKTFNRRLSPAYWDTWRMEAWSYSWDKIRARYQALWRSLLNREV